MANIKNLKKLLKVYGPDHEVAYVRWAPSSSSTQTLTEARGITSVTRSGAGAYTVNVARKCRNLVALIQVVENNTTHYHFARIESTSAAAGTVAVSHKSVAFADVATGPAGSDTVDELEVLVLMQVAS